MPPAKKARATATAGTKADKEALRLCAWVLYAYSQNSGTEQSSLPTTTGEMEVRESTAASGFMLQTACSHAANMIATFP